MRRDVTRGLIVAALLAGAVASAHAQCDIASATIGSQTSLCAIGGTAWRWSGPASFSDSNMCVMVSLPGTYQVLTFDSSTGTWTGPCSIDVPAVLGAPTATITGPDSVCADSSISLCGPSGNYAWKWDGPSGFSAATVCATVTSPGSYGLWVEDLGTGAWSAEATWMVRAGSCSPPQQVQSVSASCPMPWWWWHEGCEGHVAVLNGDVLAHIGRSVDERAQVFSFAEPASGLCRALGHATHGDMRERALRQFAAVLANVAAGDMNLTTSRGRPVRLSENATLDSVVGVPRGTSLGTWIDASDAQLVSAQALPRRHAQAIYTRIRQQAARISMGLGLVTDCTTGDDTSETSSGTLAEQTADLATDPAVDAAMATLDGVAPNPFADATRIAWTLPRDADVELVIVDLAGRTVRTLARGPMAAGPHFVTWDGRGDNGQPLRSGAYFVHGRANADTFEQRIVIVR